jgi:hypothetical protein
MIICMISTYTTMRAFLLFSICLLINSCAISFSDINRNIGNGYYYLGEGETQRYIYHSFNERIPAIDGIVVWPTVLSYDYDENFIIIKQSPNEKAIKIYLIFLKDKTSDQADSIMKADSFFINMFACDTCYWIINKKAIVLYGPFDNQSFIREKQKLMVSDKLKLK